MTFLDCKISKIYLLSWSQVEFKTLMPSYYCLVIFFEFLPFINADPEAFSHPQNIIRIDFGKFSPERSTLMYIGGVASVRTQLSLGLNKNSVLTCLPPHSLGNLRSGSKNNLLAMKHLVITPHLIILKNPLNRKVLQNHVQVSYDGNFQSKPDNYLHYQQIQQNSLFSP